MKAIRFLLFSILIILLLASLSPGSVFAQTPRALSDHSLVSDTPTAPAGLSEDDWAEINALLPAQQGYLKASNTGTEDYFGYSVAISRDTVVVGTWGEDSSATGVNGNQNDNFAPDAGAAYVFVRSGSAWSQQAYLKASNTGAGDWFGSSVAISGDIVVVGAPYEASAATGVNGNQSDNSAPGSGAAYVFVRSGSAWSQQAYLKASNTGADDTFGYSVAISGETVVVGASGEDSRAAGVNGSESDNSAPDAGAAYVFVRSGSAWSKQAYLKASNTGAEDWFGSSVGISGDTVVVGAYGEDSKATGVNGDQNNNLASYSGAAYVFLRANSAWSQQAYLKASNTGTSDYFGYSVAISGETVIVGAPYEASAASGVNGSQSDNSAPGSGAAYAFVRSGSAWSQQAYLKASNTGESDTFGYSVAISGDTAVIGAYGEDSAATSVNGNQSDNSASDSGAAYVFARTGSAWSQQAYQKASNTGAFDEFGSSVAISGDTVVVGAYGEDSGATGVNGSQSDNSTLDSGAAYVFLSKKSLSLRSQAAQDGWVLESSETSRKGDVWNSTSITLSLGDSTQNKQFRSILSFSTGILPDNAVITKVILKLRKQGIRGGGDPVNLFWGFRVDIKNGFFGSSSGLQGFDFQASADKSYGPFKPALSSGWYSLDLTSGTGYINRLATGDGVTQMRVLFKLDDNNNSKANYLRLYSGNAPLAFRPQLMIEYYVP